MAHTEKTGVYRYIYNSISYTYFVLSMHVEKQQQQQNPTHYHYKFPKKGVKITFKTPFRILPPATPPLRSSTSQPGLLTSKDLITKKNRIESNL